MGFILVSIGGAPILQAHLALPLFILRQAHQALLVIDSIHVAAHRFQRDAFPVRRGDYLDLGPVPVRLALADYPDGPFVQEYFPEDGGLRGLIVLVDRIDIIVEPYGDATSIHKCRG